MDKEVLKRRMMERAEAAVDRAIRAVEQAPDGGWVADSEWQVREAYQDLMAENFGQAVQARIDAHPSSAASSQAVFSPDGRGVDPPRQGGAASAGADGGG